MTALPSDVIRELEEERDFLLRSLHDLEAEHDAGDIDDLDYQTLKDDYTTRAAATLRALDPTLAPEEPEEPELDPQGSEVGSDSASDADSKSDSDSGSGDAAPGGGDPEASRGVKGWLRRRRRRVLVCAAVVVVGAGIGFGVMVNSSQRQAGQEITGQGVGAGQVEAELVKAQDAEDKGDDQAALADARSILTSEPTQPQALTIEGWLLVQTRQAKLVTQGMADLRQAEQIDPSFVEPHVYLASAFLSEGDNRDAIPELKWYLAHKPDPALAPKVRASLEAAEAAPSAKKAG
jgi:hypothetical protein